MIKFFGKIIKINFLERTEKTVKGAKN